MIKCDKHRKEHAGACMWCGKKLCNDCVAKQEGSKLYCTKCTAFLGTMQRSQIPRLSEEPRPVLKKGQKLVLEDGYLVIDGS